MRHIPPDVEIIEAVLMTGRDLTWLWVMVVVWAVVLVVWGWLVWLSYRRDRSVTEVDETLEKKIRRIKATDERWGGSSL